MKILQNLPSVLILIFLAACGFQPIYKAKISENQINYENKLAAIEIRGNKKRIYQKLQNNLTAVLNPNQIDIPKEYILTIKIDKNIAVTFINPTGSAGRNKVTLTASYELRKIDDEEVIARGTASAKDDFDVEGKRFADYISQEEIELNLTQLIAQNIRDSLINDLFKIE